MKQQVFYIHGGEAFSDRADYISYLRNGEMRDPYGISKTRWPSSLRIELPDFAEIFTPEMPCSQNAKYEEWKIWFERHFEYLSEEIILVGWSLGGMFLLKYLAENKFPFKIKSLFLIGAVYPDRKVVNESGEDGGDFNFDPESLINVAHQVDNITLYHSKDDFIVPYKHALKLKDALSEAELVTFDDRNHFLQEEFPELMEKIREVAGK